METRVRVSHEIKEKAFHFFTMGLNSKEIAKLLDVPSYRTVQNWMTKENWKERANPISKQERTIQLREKGFTYRNIAMTLQISVSSVRRYIKVYQSKK